MSDDKQLQSGESPRQRDAFLIYFALGKNRNLINVRRELDKNGVKISLTSVGIWSKKYEWVNRVEAMDKEASEKAEEQAIKEATVTKGEVLKMIKNTMIQYSRALLDGSVIPNVSDFKKVWEMSRIEEGKAMIIKVTEGGEPESPIKIVINQRILAIVQRAEEDMREELRDEIIKDG